MKSELRILLHVVIVLVAVCLGYYMGKAPWVGSGTLHCEYTFPTLETYIDE